MEGQSNDIWHELLKMIVIEGTFDPQFNSPSITLAIV